jgi:outer membrane murein-binding lipoprotein Lpp
MASAMIRTRRLPLLAGSCLFTASAVVGCASPGPFTSYRTTVGGLKANVATLESENEELRREVVNLKADNRRLEDDLVAERSNSDDLATRLDNARHLLSQNGGLDREISGRTDLDSPTRPLSDDPASRPKTRRSSRTPRKPPSAAIPGPLDSSSSSSRGSASDDHAWEPQAMRVKDDVWLPIASGTGSTIRR